MGSLWNRSGTIERYADDLFAPGAMAFFFQGGTTTPFTVYSDSGESSAYPSPVLADSDGRWPNVFVPFTVSYDVQVQSADGVQLTFTAQIPNPNPVDVTTIVDPASILTTGMIHGEMINTVKTGYVRLNGNTIGSSATSGTATERANDDTRNLFTYLWNLDPTIAAVSGGRGTSAASDFSPGNKVITLPDWRGLGPTGLDDMGATGGAGNFFTGLTFTVGNATMSGALIGANGISITTANMPAHSHSGTTSTESATHTHSLSVSGNINTNTGTESAGHAHGINFQSQGQSADHSHATNIVIAGGGLATIGQALGNFDGSSATAGTSNDHSHAIIGGTGAEDTAHVHNLNVTPTFTGTSQAESVTHTHTFTTNSQGSGTSFNNLSRKRLVTWFIKL